MNVHIVIPGILESIVGASLIRRLTAIDPRGCQGSGAYFVNHSEDDPRLKSILEELTAAGLCRWDGRSVPIRIGSELVFVRRERRFNANDLNVAEYLYLSHVEIAVCPDGMRSPEGLLRIPRGELGDSHSLVRAGSGVLVRMPLRRLMEQQGFTGLGFRPIVVTHAKQPVSENEQRWEIVSGIELAPMHRSVERRKLSRDQSEVIEGQVQGPGAFRNPGFDDFQVVYSRTALASVKPFDVARTWEFHSHPEDRKIIVSQRFYRFCEDQGLEIDWIPVRIEDD